MLPEIKSKTFWFNGLKLLVVGVLGGISLISGCMLRPEPEKVPPVVAAPPLVPVGWSDLEDWDKESLTEAFETFRRSCKAVGKRAGWKDVCECSAQLDPGDTQAIKRFFEGRFLPFGVQNPDGSKTGMITGYYVPELAGSRTRSERFAWPVYGVPDDLLVIDLAGVYPELKNLRLRGRVEGRKVVPYYDRKQIENEARPLKGDELFWVEDPVELFFLQVQGSGWIRLENGERVLIGFADQNGHPYHSIGRYLIDRGEMTKEQMSLQAIKGWARKNPARVGDLLNENPSYVFFRPLPGDYISPPGALGISLTAQRSLAVDPRVIPLGSPVFLSTTWPSSTTPLKKLMVAQDTGGAIKGAVRADFFWGSGREAEEYAGRMKQQGKIWILLPLEEVERRKKEAAGG